MSSKDELVEAAIQARKNAYAPYSGYSVGAAVLDESGRIWSGANVENASYSASVCAERTAIFKMVSEGGRKIVALALATKDGGWPCGICLQVMSEFAPSPASTWIHRCDEQGNVQACTLEQLLPHAFELRERNRS